MKQPLAVGRRSRWHYEGLTADQRARVRFKTLARLRHAARKGVARELALERRRRRHRRVAAAQPCRIPIGRT